MEADSLPSLYMERGEGLECSLTCEKLEATLSVLDPLHAKEPHQEVEAIHKERPKQRPLQRHQSVVIYCSEICFRTHYFF